MEARSVAFRDAGWRRALLGRRAARLLRPCPAGRAGGLQRSYVGEVAGAPLTQGLRPCTPTGKPRDATHSKSKLVMCGHEDGGKPDGSGLLRLAPGCRGRAPAPERCLRLHRHKIAAGSLPVGPDEAAGTRGSPVLHIEASARVLPSKRPCRDTRSYKSSEKCECDSCGRPGSRGHVIVFIRDS